TDRVGPSSQTGLIARLQHLFLTAGKPGLPITQAKTRVLTRFVDRPLEIRPNTENHQVGMSLVQAHYRGIVLLEPQFGDLFRCHVGHRHSTLGNGPGSAPMPPCPPLPYSIIEEYVGTALVSCQGSPADGPHTS